jgi:hypothetical protein
MAGEKFTNGSSVREFVESHACVAWNPVKGNVNEVVGLVVLLPEMKCWLGIALPVKMSMTYLLSIKTWASVYWLLKSTRDTFSSRAT